MQISGGTIDAYAEQICTWTSSSALGPWTLYGNGTPTVTLSAFSRGASNENPSLLNLPLAPLVGGASSAVSRSAPSALPVSYP